MTSTNAYWGNYYWNPKYWNADYWAQLEQDVGTYDGTEFWNYVENYKRKRKKDEEEDTPEIEAVEEIIERVGQDFLAESPAGDSDIDDEPDRQVKVDPEILRYIRASQELKALEAKEENERRGKELEKSYQMELQALKAIRAQIAFEIAEKKRLDAEEQEMLEVLIAVMEH